MSSIVHFELTYKNKDLLKDFYSKVFDWKYDTYQPVNYDLIYTKKDQKDPGIDGGFLEDDSFGQKVIITMDVEDIELVIENIKAHGGVLITPIQDMPGIGKFAYFKDPEGTIMGIMESVQ